MIEGFFGIKQNNYTKKLQYYYEKKSMKRIVSLYIYIYIDVEYVFQGMITFWYKSRSIEN